MEGLYEKYGGLRKLRPPTTCCRERENEIAKLKERVKALEVDCKTWEDIAASIEGN